MREVYIRRCKRPALGRFPLEFCLPDTSDSIRCSEIYTLTTLHLVYLISSVALEVTDIIKPARSIQYLLYR